jgi:hypothetical protein
MVPETSGHEAQSAPEGLDPGVHAAVTDICAYVLLLDAERRRLGERLLEETTPSPSHGERAQLRRLRAEMAEEVDALRLAVAALHEQGLADRAGAG